MMRSLAIRVDLREAAAALGLANAAFGLAGLAFTRPFLRFLGLPLGPHPAEEIVARSVAVRDLASGLAIWSAAIHGGKLRPWLLARAIADGGDAVAIGLALRRGEATPRLVGLGALAMLAAAVDLFLWRAFRQ